MNRIFIENLSVTGTKESSHIDFAKNLTIIAGPSDTGKSYIYKCVDYLFGAKNAPFNSSIGYDTISMKLIKNDGYIIITRKINDTKINVESHINGIESGNYSRKPNAGKSINHVYCSLLGLPKDYKVPSNEDGKEKRFTWRVLKDCLMIHEDHTEMEGPVLLPKKTTHLKHILHRIF